MSAIASSTDLRSRYRGLKPMRAGVRTRLKNVFDDTAVLKNKRGQF
jgi:hypothetical protein